MEEKADWLQILQGRSRQRWLLSTIAFVLVYEISETEVEKVEMVEASRRQIHHEVVLRVWFTF